MITIPTFVLLVSVSFLRYAHRWIKILRIVNFYAKFLRYFRYWANTIIISFSTYSAAIWILIHFWLSEFFLFIKLNRIEASNYQTTFILFILLMLKVCGGNQWGAWLWWISIWIKRHSLRSTRFRWIWAFTFWISVSRLLNTFGHLNMLLGLFGFIWECCDLFLWLRLGLLGNYLASKLRCILVLGRRIRCSNFLASVRFHGYVLFWGCLRLIFREFFS